MKHPHAYLQRRLVAYFQASGLDVVNEPAKTVATLPDSEARIESAIYYEGIARMSMNCAGYPLIERQSVARVSDVHRLLWGNDTFMRQAGITLLKRSEEFMRPKPRTVIRTAHQARRGQFLILPR